MNSDEVWMLQLWSGTFGAAISAVAAAVVALLVVTLTNKHQSRLSEIALAKQAEWASAALAGQREQAAEAFAQQEKILRQQLAEQQAEASRERSTKAAADMIAGSVELRDASLKSVEAMTVVRHRLQAAAWRWFMEGVDDDASEVVLWATHLSLFAFKANLEEARKSNGKEYDAAAGERLSNACLTFEGLASLWPSSDRDDRKGLMQALKAEREKNSSLT
ncbi:hypothetical protein SRABI26_02699 [Arthrobacter sp. Bi26]|uniref:hypothetical protein n=1 Tax=Arthrobacter sp. Bi26 TaxID=2822350 RepID=UPI001D429EA6|nr:hypothetical protein [Arthrobacter sp. Bi26]CAH0233107.1 hypothetical protein SRABI26_02699 [Arthrobacter sp. Bi26]